MEVKRTYTFRARVWQHDGPNGWFFVSLPVTMSEEIRKNLGGNEEGWGRMKARASIGKSAWDTAIWFDTKHRSYLLPLKAEVRKKEALHVNVEIAVIIVI